MPLRDEEGQGEALQALLYERGPHSHTPHSYHPGYQVRPPSQPCRCPFPAHCDDQDGFIPPTRMGAARNAGASAESAVALEDEHVNTVYNAIAPHFSATRSAEREAGVWEHGCAAVVRSMEILCAEVYWI